MLVLNLNHPRYLPEPLNSVVQQICEDCEFVGVDNETDDGTWGLFQKQE